MAKEKDGKRFLEEDYYFSPGSSSEDIGELDYNIQQLEEVLQQMEEEVRRIKSAGIAGGHMDRSKTFENIVRGRIGISDMIIKKNTIKKTAAELFLKKKSNGMADESTAEVAREMLAQLRGQDDARRIRAAIQENEIRTISNDTKASKDALKSRLSHEIESGSIVLTPNEKAMKYQAEGVTYVYVRTDKDFHAMSKAGKVLSYKEYPRERVPDFEIDVILGSYVTTKDGQRIEVV